jgi:ectoine hydroxylase-related dioxygenase (phytanoyl-CoA dioxygenase family)
MYNNIDFHNHQVRQNGYTVLPSVYTSDEITAIINVINKVKPDGNNFRQSADLFAIRRFLHEVPDVNALIFNTSLKDWIKQIAGEDYFVVKSIYFDKPGQSNWFVAWHQDLTISVKEKLQAEGYANWTAKNGQFSVQPPLSISESIYTFRIHLDDTDLNNGALKIIPGSHQRGIYRPETIDWENECEHICEVQSGGVMVMKPLLLHASDRTTDARNRRVIHIEVSNAKLPDGLEWAEWMKVD